MKQYTVLADRVLWYDGDILVPSEDAPQLIEQGIDHLCVDSLTPELTQYNKFVDGVDKVTLKNESRDIDLTWDIPDSANELDIDDYLDSKLKIELLTGNFTNSEKIERIKRVDLEMGMFKDRSLLPMIHAIIYAINTLIEQKQVWGVGRGSSVSSYVLYLIGVHDIDSVKYDIDITDFLR